MRTHEADSPHEENLRRCRFQYFQSTYSAKVKEAKQKGIHDVGILSLTGSSVREVDSRLIHVEQATGEHLPDLGLMPRCGD